MAKYPPHIFRTYEPWELGPDGYPEIWHKGLRWWEEPEYRGRFSAAPEIIAWHLRVCSADHVTAGPLDGNATFPSVGGVKDIVRQYADHRCIRCGHPYTGGKVEPAEILSEAGWRAGQDGLWRSDEFGGSYLEENALTEAVERQRRGILWSPCDEKCTHGGPVRLLTGDRWGVLDTLAEGVTAGSLVQHSVQAAWRILTVHHLNERKFDLRWHNLVALDQRCHLNVQRRVKMERAYPWDHSEWFRPYVAAFYASKYLGEELSFEQTTTRLDELLAYGKQEESVERMAL